MQLTPQGRFPSPLKGDASSIIHGGERIVALGETMTSSALTLEALANGHDGQQGKSVDAIRELVGDSHTKLRQAGELYTPAGPVIVAYGERVAELQPTMQRLADGCETLWLAYHALPGSIANPNAPAPDANDAVAVAAAQEDAAKTAAYRAWRDEAVLYDDAYDTWETAFNTAVGDISAAMSGKIKDSFWDDFDQFVAGLQNVLSIVGLVVAVLAIVIGGPIIALIASVVAVAVLALTIYQACRGDKNGWDVALAVVGIIPFGKVGMLFQGKSGVLKFGGEMIPKVFKPSAWAAAGKEARNLGTVFTFAGGGGQGLWQSAKNLYTSNNPAGLADGMSRFLTGKSTSEWGNVAAGFGEGFEKLWMFSSGFEVAHGLFGNMISRVGLVAKLTGNEAPDFPTPIDVVF